MEKQINGKRYDTSSAKFITVTKHNNVACAVYLKKTGELFCHNLEANIILPLSEREQSELKKQKEIAKRIDDVTKFIKASKTQINPYITIKTRELLQSIAAELGISESEVVERAIIDAKEKNEKLKALRISAIEKLEAQSSSFT